MDSVLVSDVTRKELEIDAEVTFAMQPASSDVYFDDDVLKARCPRLLIETRGNNNCFHFLKLRAQICQNCFKNICPIENTTFSFNVCLLQCNI